MIFGCIWRPGDRPFPALKQSCNSMFCYTKCHSKIELRFCRNCNKQTCLRLFRVLGGTEIFIFHHAPTSGTSMLHDNFMKNVFSRALICPFTNDQIRKIVCRLTNNLLCCQFPRPENTSTSILRGYKFPVHDGKCIFHQSQCLRIQHKGPVKSHLYPRSPTFPMLLDLVGGVQYLGPLIGGPNPLGPGPGGPLGPGP